MSKRMTVEQARAAESITNALAEFGLPGLGAPVTKIGTGYSGPGVVCGVAIAEDGSPRVVIAHRIEGGTGALMHIYTPGLIQAEKENGQ